MITKIEHYHRKHFMQLIVSRKLVSDATLTRGEKWVSGCFLISPVEEFILRMSTRSERSRGVEVFHKQPNHIFMYSLVVRGLIFRLNAML